MHTIDDQHRRDLRIERGRIVALFALTLVVALIMGILLERLHQHDRTEAGRFRDYCISVRSKVATGVDLWDAGRTAEASDRVVTIVDDIERCTDVARTTFAQCRDDAVCRYRFMTDTMARISQTRE